MTLTIESGPGEFPTGPDITFAPDSDIPIRAGQAAMEFRSYFAGKTLIRATSPGLKDATIELISLGESQYIAGQTPAVKSRPYVRFSGSAAGTPITLGRNNPTRASSEAPGHSGRLANDGNSTTFWQAAAGDTNAWWQVDLERIVTVQKAKLTFPTSGNWRYLIELSDDGASGWKLLADQSQTTNVEQAPSFVAPNSPRGRFLHVGIIAAPAGQRPALAEFEVQGTLTAQ